MKKISLIVAPLAIFFFLTNCNSASKYEVTEVEFNDALAFKNIQYLQEFIDVKTTGDMEMAVNATTVVAPNISQDMSDVKTAQGETYTEYAIKKESKDKYVGYSRQSSTADWSKITTDASIYFLTAEDVGKRLQQMGYFPPYSAFKYNQHVYNATEGTINYTFEFCDKKIVKMNVCNVDGITNNATITFTYEEKTPVFPPVQI